MPTLSSHRAVFKTLGGIIAVIIVLVSISNNRKNMMMNKPHISANSTDNFEWQPPGLDQLIESENFELIRYGRDLIAYTSFYFGPKGIIKQISNGMNCQNCHLDAGTKRWANNFSAVASSYPRFRERSGSVENMHKRINDCFERSLNADKGLDTTSKEMKAIVSYMNWLGKEVPDQVVPIEVSIKVPTFSFRAADPEEGEIIYQQHCSRCHGKNGNGAYNADSTLFIYPPLWGANSYTTAAGMHHLSRFAGFVRNNMPFDAPGAARLLTDHEAWDVAAFVNSQPRPHKEYKNDWPDIAAKPYDHPFGPYTDGVSEKEHKYGPWIKK
jgi:thiosulfate dehydrogenase